MAKKKHKYNWYTQQKDGLLDQYRQMLEANYQQRLEINSEFDMIAFMKTVHEEYGVGPGRAFKSFNAFMANKLEIAETIHEDYGPDKQTGDKQILHTKSSYAKLIAELEAFKMSLGDIVFGFVVDRVIEQVKAQPAAEVKPPKMATFSQLTELDIGLVPMVDIIEHTHSGLLEED